MKDQFPVLFACSTHLDAPIASLLVSSSSAGLWEWNIIFVHAFNDWEVDDVASFFQILNSHIPSSVGLES